MSKNNIRELVLEDINTLKTQTIPTLSAKEMYGTLVRYYAFFWSLILMMNLGGELLFYRFGYGIVSHIDGASLGQAIFIGLFESFCVGVFLTLFIFIKTASKVVIFNKTIRPMIKTGDMIAAKLKKYMFFLIIVYAFVLFITSIIFQWFGASNIAPLLVCSFLHNFIENTEFQRLGIPEFPKLINHFLDGTKKY